MSHKVDVVVVGGGSGGHITPLVSVSEALKYAHPDRRIAHIGHRNDPLNDVTRQAEVIDAVYEVSAGKFRRYHTHSMVTKLLDFKTNLLNFRDLFRFLWGVVQAWRLLGQLRPRVIFMKGGYVCANVGYAAKLRKIPYITHDSDAMVSLAHRVIAKDALEHLTALPPQFYPEYDQSKTVQVGIPVKQAFAPVDSKAQSEAKKELHIPIDAQFVLITGGGLGAQNINDGVLRSASELLSQNNIHMLLLAGNKTFDTVQKQYEALSDDIKARFIIEPFTHKMEQYSAAADVIVTRASMTALTEFGVQGKACVIVPNPLLAGGHQLKNASALLEENAVQMIREEDFASHFTEVVSVLLADSQKRGRLGHRLQTVTISDAAQKIMQHLDAVGGGQ